MKLFLWIILMTVLNGSTLAQTVFLEVEAGNYLYRGFQNKINIMGDVPLRDVVVEAPNATITFIKPGAYFVAPLQTGDLEITLKYKHKLIRKYKYRVNNYPLQIVSINRISDEGRMTIQELTKVSRLTVIDDSPIKYLIKSFKARIIRDGVNIGSIINDGAFFELNFKQFLQQLKSGDELLFSDMKYTMEEASGMITDVHTVYNSANPNIRIFIN